MDHNFQTAHTTSMHMQVGKKERACVREREREREMEIE
jgi:hypothetical protein